MRSINLIVMCLLAVTSCQAFAEIPIRDFARFAKYNSVKLSPSGEYLAVATPVNDQTALAIIRTADRKPTGGLRFIRNEHVANYWWVGPSRIVATIAFKDGPLSVPRLTGELFGIDADGQRERYLFGYRGLKRAGTRLRNNETYERAWAWMVDPLPREPDWILVRIASWGAGPDAAFQPVFRLNVISGDREKILQPPHPYLRDYLTDRFGHIRYASGHDEHLKWRSYVRNLETGEWTRLKHDEFASAEIQPIGFSESENAAYFGSNEINGDLDCLIRQDLATNVRKLLACDPKQSITTVIMSADDSRPIAAVFEAGKPDLRVVAPDHPDGRLIASLSKTFSGQALDQFSWSLDGGRLVFRAYSDRNPGEYFLYDRATKKAEHLLSARSWIDPRQMAERRHIELTARDGRPLHGFMTIPLGRPPRMLPLVVIPHGGPFGLRDDWEWDPEAQLLANRGYLVLQVNFRGSYGYGAAHLAAGKKNFGLDMINDITDGVRHVISRGFADPGRICIYGGSYGGYAALMSAVREPDLYKCAVGYAGVYDLHNFKKDTDIKKRKRGRTYLQDFIADGEEAERLQSPITHIEKLKAAVMIVHGEEDERAPFSQAILLRKALDKKGHHYEWFSKAGEEHGFYNEDNRVELYEKLLAFLDKHIGKGNGAGANGR